MGGYLGCVWMLGVMGKADVSNVLINDGADGVMTDEVRRALSDPGGWRMGGDLGYAWMLEVVGKADLSDVSIDDGAVGMMVDKVGSSVLAESRP